MQLKTLALILLLCAPAVYAAEAAVSEGQVAPSFEVALADGQAADLATISKTRPTVVLFWASWCPYCKALMPHLQSLLDEYGSEKLEIIAVSIREDAPEDAAPVALEREVRRAADVTAALVAARGAVR